MTVSKTCLWAVLILSMGLSACSKHETLPADQIAPQTGSPLTEGLVAPAPVANKAGAIGYISTDSVRVRTSPANGENAVGRLFTNDKVELIDGTPIGADQFVAIRVVQSNSNVDRGQTFYISQRFVSATPVDVEAVATSALLKAAPGPAVSGQKPVRTNRLFIVTNIATERLRVYERCLPSEGCVNRMVMEAKVINGESKDGTRTNAGFFQVSSWTKFYETLPLYPAWYKEGYPDVPQVGDRSGWISKKFFPNDKAESRGGFGWYTAKVQPNHYGQWTHGTYGRGGDKTKMIDFKDSFLGAIVNIFAAIRSHGCTRVDNESIAYIRQLVSVGTPLIKIYAQEAYRDESRARYTKTPGRWEYILTKNGAQQVGNHQLADRAMVLKQGTPQSEWLDQGTYEIDQYPDAESGDLYYIGEFRGAFLVDEGTLLNYQHPAKIGRGGFSDQIAPPYMITTDPKISEPRRRYSPRGPRNDPFGQYGG